MKRANIITIISILIIILAALTSILAVIPAEGQSHTIISQWEEEIEIHGRGLYSRDSHSYAIQAIAQDWITLILGIPLMIISLILVRKDSFRGKLLQTGILGYFLYTYMSYSFLMTYNNVFIIYVALFSLSLFGFIFSFIEIEVEKINDHIKQKFPVRSTSFFFIIIGSMLLFMWLERIVPSLSSGKAPYGLESYTTLVIQAMDLGIIVPVAFFTAFSLLRKTNIGFALSAVVILKGVTLFSAISAMAILMKLNGIEINSVELIIFPAVTLINFLFCILILKNVK
jgi:hypothetical protein